MKKIRVLSAASLTVLGVCVANGAGIPTSPAAKVWGAESVPDDIARRCIVEHMLRLPYPRQDRWPLLVWGDGPPSGDALQEWIDRGIAPLLNSSRTKTSRERLFAVLNGESTDHVPVWLLFPYHRLGCYVDVQNLPGYREVFEASKQYAIMLNRIFMDTLPRYCPIFSTCTRTHSTPLKPRPLATARTLKPLMSSVTISS